VRESTSTALAREQVLIEQHPLPVCVDVINRPFSRLRLEELRRACCPDRRLCKKKFPSLPRGRFGDVTESNRWLEHQFAEIAQLRGRCDRLFDELGGTDHGAWMPAVRSRAREPASCIDRRIAFPGSAP
jgi:hypothetical protein